MANTELVPKEETDAAVRAFFASPEGQEMDAKFRQELANGLRLPLLLRIAELEAALASLVSASADVETGRSVHNSRRPDDQIEGPVWVAMTNAVYDARTVLQKKPVTD